MSFATRDLVLAIAHHLLVFTLAGVLAFEFGSIQENMTAKDVRRIANVDIWYGVLAAAILAVGFARAVFATKGWAYYSVNFFFWAKIATFAAMGLLSIQPTIALLGWRRALAKEFRGASRRAGHTRRPQVPVGRGPAVRLHPGLRGGHGPRLRRIERIAKRRLTQASSRPIRRLPPAPICRRGPFGIVE